ncbi:MAG: DUF4350 domain-containing protein [Burkholderiales bacterium]|nr:DUF4350 domain-containing protein [Burkholderiales bacterium]
MKSLRLGNALVGLVFIILVGLAVWWWQDNMERRTEAVAYTSEDARKDPHLAARRLLQSIGVRTQPARSLAEMLAHPNTTGVVLIGRRNGAITPDQGEALLNWVEEGGILLTTVPLKRDDESSKDPIAAAYQVQSQLAVAKRAQDIASMSSTPVNLVLPAPIAHPLVLAAAPKNPPLPVILLRQGKDAPQPLWQDAQGQHIMAFEHGDGLVIVLDYDRFAGNELIRQDHGELLVSLVHLQPNRRSVTFVETLDVPHWQTLLWENAPALILSTALLLALLLWRGLMRFGPILADPTLDRRAVTEHIDASARWLWLRAPGRHALLKAVRTAVLDRYKRRFPALATLGPAALANRLAAMHNLPIADIETALNLPPADTLQGFTQQIMTLQLLRKHHER